MSLRHIFERGLREVEALDKSDMSSADNVQFGRGLDALHHEFYPHVTA